MLNTITFFSKSQDRVTDCARFQSLIFTLVLLLTKNQSMQISNSSSLFYQDIHCHVSWLETTE